MSPLTQSLVELTRLFDRLGLAYALMGGLAVRVYGIPRATYDIDFTLAIGREDLDGLYRAVEGLGYTRGLRLGVGGRIGRHATR